MAHTAQSSALPCRVGVARAGFSFAPSGLLFDGIQATVEPLNKRYSGLYGTEHVGGYIGLGGQTYAGASISGLSGDPRGTSGFSYEWWTRGYNNFQPALDFGAFPNRAAHVIKVERVFRITWRFSMDGRVPRRHGVVTLSSSAGGLRYPRAYLTDRNENLPCDNHGVVRFEDVRVRRHGSRRWEPLPLGTVPFAEPGEALHVLSRTSFVARTVA
jgi:hypothetical protein